MQAGERVAVIAAGPEVLRLAAPERHGPFLRGAGSVIVLAGDTPCEARILEVYPEIPEGRVRADLEAAALPPPRFTGQRVGVRLPAGTRETIVVPRRFLSARSGLVFAHREGEGPVLVQTGRAWPDRVEVLSGLVAGDRLVPPDGCGR